MTMPGVRGARFDVVEARLRESLSANSAVVLAADPRRMGDVPASISRHFGVTEFNVTSALLTAMRDVAADNRIEWEFLLRVDAREADTPDRAKLNEFVATAVERVWPRVMEEAHPLVLTDVDILARYGKLDRIENLLDLATQRPAARWILVPYHSSQGAPTLEGEPVPLPPEGWVSLPAQLFDEPAAG